MTQIITIYTESSPNPNTIKFVFNFNLLENVSIDYPSIEDTKNCPLANDLFKQFNYVEGVFIAANFISITKNEDADWYEASPEIRDFLKAYFQEEKPVFSASITKDLGIIEEGNTENQEIVEKIKSLLDEYVRPAVESDGGAISFHSYNNGIVKVLLQGACSGCPSSTVTLKSGIENLLKNMMPDEVTEVVAEGV